GALVNIPIAAGLDAKAVEKEAASLFEPQLLFIADSVVAGKAAAKAGMKKGDQLVKLGNDSIVYFQQFAMGLQRYKATPTTITVIRDNQLVVLSVTPDADGKIGVQPQGPDKQLGFKHTDYGFGGACVRGFQLTGEKLVSYVKQLRLVFTPEGASKIGGFASIGSIFPSTWDWQAFWSITAFLSIILAFMNLLPIPVLDGGYILFVLWEMITGRKVSDKVMSVAMSIGMFLVLALLLLANGNDIYRFLIK
ncbi:MAG: site-2 protease family protein, partial [Bacteroidia bacterium]